MFDDDNYTTEEQHRSETSFKLLQERIDALGDCASAAQQSKLVDWIMQRFNTNDLSSVAEELLFAQMGSAYTDVRMRMSECGAY